MTKEGRLKTHLYCLKIGKTSPYANEFKDHIVNVNSPVKTDVAKPVDVEDKSRRKRF